jgi:hypothetical protein
MNFESGCYPDGAEYDSNAPYNQVIPEKEDVNVFVSITLSKSFTVRMSKTDDVYEIINDQITTPECLSSVVNTAFDCDLDLKAAGMPLFLKQAIEDSDDWFIDDCEIVPE